MSTNAAPQFVLPPALIGRPDLARLVREIETVDNDFEAQKVRDHKTEDTYSIPTMSRALSDFLVANQIKIVDAKARTALKERLLRMKDKAPIIHVTFAADADPEFLQQLVGWIRTEIHPEALLSVGLQPSLVGGVYMRTPNHVHDFSLRQLLADKRGIIVNELQGLLQ